MAFIWWLFFRCWLLFWRTCFMLYNSWNSFWITMFQAGRFYPLAVWQGSHPKFIKWWLLNNIAKHYMDFLWWIFCGHNACCIWTSSLYFYYRYPFRKATF